MLTVWGHEGGDIRPIITPLPHAECSEVRVQGGNRRKQGPGDGELRKCSPSQPQTQDDRGLVLESVGGRVTVKNGEILVLVRCSEEPEMGASNVLGRG